MGSSLNTPLHIADNNKNVKICTKYIKNKQHHNFIGTSPPSYYVLKDTCGITKYPQHISYKKIKIDIKTQELLKIKANSTYSSFTSYSVFSNLI